MMMKLWLVLGLQQARSRTGDEFLKMDSEGFWNGLRWAGLWWLISTISKCNPINGCFFSFRFFFFVFLFLFFLLLFSLLHFFFPLFIFVPLLPFLFFFFPPSPPCESRCCRCSLLLPQTRSNHLLCKTTIYGNGIPFASFLVPGQIQGGNDCRQQAPKVTTNLGKRRRRTL